MTETNKKKPRINPGLVRSEADYKKSKTAALSNPTKQAASVALPVTEKETTFVEMYAESLKLSWLPLTTEEIVAAPVVEEKAQTQPKPKKEAQKAKVKFEKVTPEPVKKSKPSDMEILMANSDMIQEAPKPKAAFIEPVEITDLPKQEEKPENNVFESINAIPVSPEAKKDEKEDRNKLNTTRPYMKIDKVEVRKTTNADGITVYMIGKDIYNTEQFAAYMQGIYGKILASDCKRIEFEDATTYTRQGDGSYKANSGNIVSVDDLISILSTK